jgi:hypothetical protein
MVPGSTFRYGSSFWRETLRWRAFRMFPIDAAVMPFPSEETTPPVTKTYFDIETSRAVLTMVPDANAELSFVSKLPTSGPPPERYGGDLI